MGSSFLLLTGSFVDSNDVLQHPKIIYDTPILLVDIAWVYPGDVKLYQIRSQEVVMM